MNRRLFLGSLLSLPFAKPALKVLLVPARVVASMSSRYARYRALKLEQERRLWQSMYETFEDMVWSTDEIDLNCFEGPRIEVPDD